MQQGMAVKFTDGRVEAFPEANNVLVAADGSLVLSFQSQKSVERLGRNGMERGLEVVSELVACIAVGDGWRRVEPLHERSESTNGNGAADASYLGEEVVR